MTSYHLRADRPYPASESADDLTPSQREFLESLPPDCRARLDQMSAAKRTSILRPHAFAFQPHLGGFQARTELRPRWTSSRPDRWKGGQS